VGATGGRQYPGISVDEKLNMWKEVETIFDGVLLDTRISSVGRTPIRALVERNHRLVVYASDYDEFTNASPYALDGAFIDNFWRGNAVFEEPDTLAAQREYLATAAERNADVRERGGGSGFTLMSMNTAGQGWQIKGAAQERFLPWPLDRLFNNCASRMGTSIPGGDGIWCPETLLDVSQLSNYYGQIAMEEAYHKSEACSDMDKTVSGTGWDLPNAFYLDALDYNGLLRTGPTPLFGSARHAMINGTKAYAYVDTVIAHNVWVACEGRLHSDSDYSNEERHFTFPSNNIASLPQMAKGRYLQNSSVSSNLDTGGARSCEGIKERVKRRRANHSLSLWVDATFGRRSDWPTQTEVRLFAQLQRKR